MQISQGNSLWNYLYLNQAKMSFFLFSFMKLENRRAEQILPRLGWGVGLNGRREAVGKIGG
jgi:hypothetical protein